MNEIKIEKSILKKSVLRGSHFENSILADTIFDNCDLKKYVYLIMQNLTLYHLIQLIYSCLNLNTISIRKL